MKPIHFILVFLLSITALFTSCGNGNDTYSEQPSYNSESDNDATITKEVGQEVSYLKRRPCFEQIKAELDFLFNELSVNDHPYPDIHLSVISGAIAEHNPCEKCPEECTESEKRHYEDLCNYYASTHRSAQHQLEEFSEAQRELIKMLSKSP